MWIMLCYLFLFQLLFVISMGLIILLLSFQHWNSYGRIVKTFFFVSSFSFILPKLRYVHLKHDFWKKNNIFLSFSFGSEHQRRVKRKNVARFSIVRLLIEHFLFGRFVYKQIILINNEKESYDMQHNHTPSSRTLVQPYTFFPIHFVFLLHEFILETFRSIKF